MAQQKVSPDSTLRSRVEERAAAGNEQDKQLLEGVKKRDEIEAKKAAAKPATKAVQNADVDNK